MGIEIGAVMPQFVGPPATVLTAELISSKKEAVVRHREKWHWPRPSLADIPGIGRISRAMVPQFGPTDKGVLQEDAKACNSGIRPGCASSLNAARDVPLG